MSKVPPEIARFRQKGTQIKFVRGHWYLQRVTSKWDKQAKKVRKVTLGYVGRVTPEGVIPRRTPKSIPRSSARLGRSSS